MEADGTGTPEGWWERRRVPMRREGNGEGETVGKAEDQKEV